MVMSYDYNYTRPIDDPILKQAGICMYKAGYIVKFSTATKTEEPYIVLDKTEYDAARYGETAELNPFSDTLSARRQLDILHDYLCEHESKHWHQSEIEVSEYRTQREFLLGRVTWCLEKLMNDWFPIDN